VIRPAGFSPAARKAIRNFPDEVRRALGQAIFELQEGKTIGMPLSRPMSIVAPGVSELRVKDASGVYRVFYFVRSIRGVLVFHAFSKKSQKTPASEIALGRRRLKEMLS